MSLERIFRVSFDDLLKSGPRPASSRSVASVGYAWNVLHAVYGAGGELKSMGGKLNG